MVPRPTDTTVNALDELEPVAMASREYQRCYWYQVVKKSDVVAGSTSTPTENAQFGDANVNWRSMTVLVNRPLQAKTLLYATGASQGYPYHVNAALVSPHVVNVFPKTFYAH
jgi:hypothetical protein